MIIRRRAVLALSLHIVWHVRSWAGGVPTSSEWLEEVVVRGKLDVLAGEPISASVGTVTSEQLDLRPVLRTGELLEVVPGLIVTQHSGGGKANQYFLRGFNLDHGTDLATSVDGVPVNMPTHAHGQGYTDINFVIPELVQSIDYRKGTYYAETGNFSAAGAVNMRYRDASMRRSSRSKAARTTIGARSWRRLRSSAPGTLLFGVDYSESDGPWVLRGELARKTTRSLRYSSSDGDRADSRSPRRPTTVSGIRPTRFRSAQWTTAARSFRLRRSAPMAATRIATASASTGSPMLGDAAVPRASHTRSTTGSTCSRTSLTPPIPSTATSSSSSTIAASMAREVTWRSDRSSTGRYTQRSQTRRADCAATTSTPSACIEPSRASASDTIREDDVVQTSYSAYASLTTTWSDVVRTTVGVRADYFDFDVESNLAVEFRARDRFDRQPEVRRWCSVRGTRRNSSSTSGAGFHSNDARGTTIRVDPNDGVTPADRVDPLVSCARIRLWRAHVRSCRTLKSAVAVAARSRFGAAVRRRCRPHRAESRQSSAAVSSSARSGIRLRG